MARNEVSNMRIFTKRAVSFLLAMVVCFGLLSGIGFSASAATVDYVTGYDETFGAIIKNWGERGETATFLSPNAEDFYSTNKVIYSTLRTLSGSADTATTPESALYLELSELVTSNQTTVTTYDGTKNLYAYTDIQNNGNDSEQISSFYSGKLIGPAWDGGATWNREHTWPNSKGDDNGKGENDIMMLRPASKEENGGRSNKAYGESDGYYFPNTESGGTYDVRGDVARIMLYVYTRWGTENMWGSSGVIESKEVLLKWMEEDPVDTWEMGRNDSVQSITGTRNVYVDYPELAFCLFNEAVPADMQTPSGGKDVDIPQEETNVIVANNVGFAEKLHMMYAIDASSIAKYKTVVIHLFDENGKDLGSATRIGSQTVKGIDCAVFTARNGIAVQDIAENICAKVVADGDVIAESRRSVLEYLHSQLITNTSITENQKTMYRRLITYAGTLQTILLNQDEPVACKDIANYRFVTVKNGTIDEIHAAGMLNKNDPEALADLQANFSAADGKEIRWNVTVYDTADAAGVTYKGQTETQVLAFLAAGKHLVLEAVEADSGTTEPSTPSVNAYVEKSLAEIKPTDKVVITMTASNGTVYAISNDKGTSAAPTASIITVADGKITSDVGSNLLWNISNDGGNLSIYVDGDDTKWLYCTNTNNGVRVGTNTNNVFTIDASSGYLKNTATSRYLGVYTTNPDWRCYTNTTGNTKDQTLRFYVWVD